MALTLEQAKVGMADKVEQKIYDEFRRGSMLLDAMLFDDTVSPGTGGSTLTYGYTRLKTPAAAQFRAINEEYSASEAEKEKVNVDLAIFGGAFEIDRVLINTSSSIINELDFQVQQKVKAAINHFHYNVINGDTAVESKGFDGLNKALLGTNTEVNAEGIIDLSSIEGLKSNMDLFMEQLETMLSEMDGKPSFLLMNGRMKAKFNTIARLTGYFSRSEDAFGNQVADYNGIPILDMEYFHGDGKTTPVVKIEDRGENTGVSDIYAVKMGIDGFHAASPLGGRIIHTYLPDLTAPGAVKRGEVEMVAAPVLKSTRAAGVLRNIKL